MFISELVPLIWRQRVLLQEISELMQRAFNAVVADLRKCPAGPSPGHLEVLRVSKKKDRQILIKPCMRIDLSFVRTVMATRHRVWWNHLLPWGQRWSLQILLASTR